MTTASFGNFGSGEAIEEAAASISQMSSDIAAMAQNMRSVTSSMNSASAASGRWSTTTIGGTGGATGPDFGRIASSFSGGIGSGAKTAITEILKSTAKTAADVALLSYNDLRVGRDQAMEMEQQRLIARAGTGDFSRFQSNLNISMNDINVQDRWQVTKDLAAAYSSYYGQAMGGGLGGEQRTAMAVGAMHTLASVAGLSAGDVSPATGALYSSQAYYRAMAAGIQTRNPVTGDMLNPEEIVNQYRKRLGRNTPEEIKRALGPGGTLRAELMQTWGDAGLVEMISKGLVISAEAGAPLTVGDIASAASKAGGGEAGYVGTQWTQGRDTESLKAGAMQNRVAEYTNDVTAGVATTNTILADINAKIANLEGPFRSIVAATETFGGIMDQAMADMNGTATYVWNTAKDAIGGLVGALTSPGPGSLMAGIQALSGLGTLVLGGAVIGAITSGAAEEAPHDAPSGPGASQTAQAAVMPGSGGSGDLAPAVQASNVSATQAAYTQAQASATATEASPTVSTQSASLSDESAVTKTTTNNVSINLTVQNATDREAIRFAAQVKEILSEDQELAEAGSGAF